MSLTIAKGLERVLKFFRAEIVRAAEHHGVLCGLVGTGDTS